MKKLRAIAFLAALVVFQTHWAMAQSGAAQDLPHAFPREGAIQVFDNEWGTAWNVTWTPLKPTSLHRHAFDYVGVDLVNATFKLSGPRRQPATASTTRGTSFFLPRGNTHVEEGVSSNPPRHAVLIDLKDTPSRSYENLTNYPLVLPASTAKKVTDNQRVVMWDQTWVPNQIQPMSFYDKNLFIMIVDGGELTLTAPDTAAQILSVSPGQVLFYPGNQVRTLQANKGPVRAIIAELK